MATVASKWSSRRRPPTSSRTAYTDNADESFFQGAIVAFPFGLLLWSGLVWAIHALF